MLIVFTGFIRVLARTLFRGIDFVLSFPTPLRHVLKCAKSSGQNFLRQIPLHPFNCKSCCGILFLFKKEKKKREVGHVLSGHVLSRHALWALLDSVLYKSCLFLSVELGPLFAGRGQFLPSISIP